MDSPSPSVRALAKRILAVEAASRSAPGPHAHEAIRVSEKLRVSLTRFAGADGFTALLRRALALARAEVSVLQGVTVKADGSFEGLDALALQSPAGAVDAAGALTTHLLALMMTFIGASLTVRLVGAAWPDALLDE